MENSLSHWNFKAGKSTSRLKYVQNQRFITMHWIKEVQIAKSIDDIMTLPSITGRGDFLDYEMLDAMTASTLKKLPAHMHFRKRVSVEGPILTRKTDCLHDLRAFSGHGSL